MAKKSQQYVQGSDFVTAVVGKVGIEGLNKAWEGRRIFLRFMNLLILRNGLIGL